MTAYELADELAKYDWYYEETFVGEDGYTQERQVCWTSLIEESAAMLRQQADRIAELDKQVGIFDAELMKARISNSLMKTDRDRLAKGHKELSDEEIISIRQITKPSSADNWADTLAFARAIEERHGIK